MAAGPSAAAAPKSSPLVLLPKPVASLSPSQQSFFPPSLRRGFLRHCRSRRTTRLLTVCFVLDDRKQAAASEIPSGESSEDSTRIDPVVINSKAAERLARKRSERFTYLVAAVMSSFGITSMSVMAVYYRFSWQMGVKISALPCIFRLVSRILKLQSPLPLL